VAKTLDWLWQHRPTIALGNLRQPAGSGRDQEFSSARITDHLRRGDWLSAAIAAERTPTINWLAWPHEPQPTDAPVWHEDLFFVNRAFLETIRFLDHGGPQIFQDVFDLMGALLAKLGRYDAQPSCPRMPREVNQVLHLWHDRRMACFSPAVREHFLRNADRWQETLYASRPHWQALDALYARANRDGEGEAVWNFRRDPGGSVWRYAMDVERWLEAGGIDAVRAYLDGARPAGSKQEGAEDTEVVNENVQPQLRR
jgi:hypothetical protein